MAEERPLYIREGSAWREIETWHEAHLVCSLYVSARPITRSRTHAFRLADAGGQDLMFSILYIGDAATARDSAVKMARLLARKGPEKTSG